MLLCSALFFVYTGTARTFDNLVDFELQEHRRQTQRFEAQRQRDIQLQREQAERARWRAEQLQRRQRMNREIKKNRELRHRLKRLLKAKIRSVLVQLPFIRKCQIAISDRLRRGDIPLHEQPNLLGMRVQVIGKGFGTIVGQTSETLTSTARDIVEFDPIPQRSESYRKALVLGTSRRKKGLRRSAGKTFRIISKLVDE